MTAPASVKKYYIGLMSGTSADGIDLALVSFNESATSIVETGHFDNTPYSTNLIAHYYQPYSETIANKITSLYSPEQNEIDRAFSLDVALAHLFSEAINHFLEQENLTKDNIIAIGSHGQTIRHRPLISNPFTLQIGCCQTLSTLTGIRVIGQFRHKDIALGGQGAPLVPAFHDTVFREKHTDVFIVNIGGIANITYLPKCKTIDNEEAGFANKPVIGFDTGPGNALMDEWFLEHNIESTIKYDKNGVWAGQGKVDNDLLAHFLDDYYFALSSPKSTGREVFNLHWLHQKLHDFSQNHIAISPQSVQATLTMLTAVSICNEIIKLAPSGLVYLCGGGVHNTTLYEYISTQLNNSVLSEDTPFELLNTNAKNIDGDQLEAVAFAWLAFAYDKQLISNMPAVTGARKPCTLGACFTP